MRSAFSTDRVRCACALLHGSRLPDALALSLLWAGAAAWIAHVQYDPFFWDTVQLGSKHAHFFYENGLRWRPLPTEIDSGHPPTFGYYLAWVWQLFGRTLPVSHWATFPFVAGAITLLYWMGKRMGQGPLSGLGLTLLAAADPLIASQSGLVGPDIAIAFFFLLAVEGAWSSRSWQVSLAVLGLCALSLRGMMTAVGLLAWRMYALWSTKRWNGKRAWSEIFVFLPGISFAVLFLYWHYRSTGWTGYHSGSPWASAFAPAGAMGILRNAVVVGWRWLDFGRIFEWIGFFWLLACGLDKRQLREHPHWIALLGTTAVFLLPSALFYQNLSAHRYFLPVFLSAHLLFWKGWCCASFSRKKRGLIVVLIGLFSGNWWRYPHGIAMGWDATLAHRFYHGLRQEVFEYIEKTRIPLECVGTAFPNYNCGKHLLLNDDQRMWAEFDPERNEYSLISNVFNDVSPQHRSYLRRFRKQLWRGERCGVWVELYGRP